MCLSDKNRHFFIQPVNLSTTVKNATTHKRKTLNRIGYIINIKEAIGVNMEDFEYFDETGQLQMCKSWTILGNISNVQIKSSSEMLSLSLYWRSNVDQYSTSNYNNNINTHKNNNKNNSNSYDNNNL